MLTQTYIKSDSIPSLVKALADSTESELRPEFLLHFVLLLLGSKRNILATEKNKVVNKS